MNKLDVCGVKALLLLLPFAILGSSCMNEELDLSKDNLNLEITPFQEGVVLPIGATEKILLDSLLKDVDEKILSAGENGVFGINYLDSVDVSEELASLKDLVKIPEITFEQDIEFSLADKVNVSDMTVKAQDFSYDYDLANVVTSIPDLSLDLESIDKSAVILDVKEDYSIPGGLINETPIPLDMNIFKINTDFSSTQQIPLNVSLPKEIRSISGIKLKDGAKVRISFGLSTSFLHSGEIIPDITIGLGDVFKIEGGSSVKLSGMKLSEKNNYMDSKDIFISSLAIDDAWTEIDGHKVINKTISIPVSGSILWNNLYTTTKLLNTNRKLELSMSVEFVDVEVADYKVEIADFKYTVDKPGEEISIEIPDALAKVGEISLYPEKPASIELDVNIPEIGLDIVPAGDGIKISFPKMLRFASNLNPEYGYKAEDNSINLKKSLNELGTIKLPVEKIVITPEKVGDKYYAKGTVDIKGTLGLASNVLTKSQVDNFANPGGDRRVAVGVRMSEFRPKSVSMNEFPADIEEKTFDFDILSGKDVPSELKSINVVEFKDTELNIDLDIAGFPDMGKDARLAVDLQVKFNPADMLNINGAENGVYKIRKTINANEDKITLGPIQLLSLDLTGKNLAEGIKGTISVSGQVRLVNPSLNIDEWLGRKLKASFNASMDAINISKVSGKVAYNVEPITQTVDLKDLTGTLGDSGVEVNLDLNHAHIILEVETNLAVPVKAEVELIPYYEGTPGTKINPVLAFTPKVSDEPTVTKFWLAADRDRMPAEGYDFIEADVLSLLKNIPEKIDVNLKAGTNEDEVCVLEPQKDYSLKARYMLDVPLEFGEEFQVVYRDTIPDLPKIVGALLAKGNQVGLGGKLVNSLPLGLDVSFNFLDSDKEKIESAQNCGVLHVSPCSIDGTASTKDINVLVGVADGAKALDAAYLEIEVNANSGGIVGVPVKKGAYLQAVLHAVLPKGVTVDVNDLINSEEDK